MSFFKKSLICLVLFTVLSSSIFAASYSNPFLNDVDNNPAKLFFKDSSLFIGEIAFKDLFNDSSISHSILKNPALDVNVQILGGMFALKLGANVDMLSKNALYVYDATMERYMNIAFSLGYGMFSFGAGLTLKDERMHNAIFNQNIPILSFIWESYFVGYNDIPGSTDSFLNLSLMVSDKEYFGVSVTAPDFLHFNTTDPVFDWTLLYKNLVFSAFFKTPTYDRNDDLNIVTSSLTLDAISILGDTKKLSITNIISLVLSPIMYLNLLNTLDFTFISGVHYSLNDSNFLHTIALEYKASKGGITIGFELPPSLYRGENGRFYMFLKGNVIL